MTLSEASSAGDRLLVRYLLGHLSDAQAERFDRSSIEDDDFADRLRLIEQELVDGYVRRTLPAERWPASNGPTPRRRGSCISQKCRNLSARDRRVAEASVAARSILAHAASGVAAFTRLLALAAAIVVSAAIVLSLGAFGSRRSGAESRRRHCARIP
jgi:hypothetical protein